MKISMITSKHKMAPGWRHGWVITLKKLKFSIPDNDKDTVQISTWLLILFLRYHGPKIHTERNNNNNENKIRTNSIGDMPLYGISPNKYWENVLCIPRWKNAMFPQKCMSLHLCIKATWLIRFSNIVLYQSSKCKSRLLCLCRANFTITQSFCCSVQSSFQVGSHDVWQISSLTWSFCDKLACLNSMVVQQFLKQHLYTPVKFLTRWRLVPSSVPSILRLGSIWDMRVIAKSNCLQRVKGCSYVMVCVRFTMVC